MSRSNKPKKSFDNPVTEQQTSKETELAINRLRYVANGIAAIAAGVVFANAQSQFLPLIIRLIHFNLQDLDYVYVAIYLMLIWHGFCWFHFGNQENDQIIAWVKPKHFTLDHTPGHTASLLLVGVLFIFLFLSVTDIYAFLFLYSIYEFVDIFQAWLKRKDFGKMLTGYAKQMGCPDPFSGRKGRETRLECKALYVLHHFNFVQPMLKLHGFLLGASLILFIGVSISDGAIFGDIKSLFHVSHANAVIIGYLGLFVAFAIHEMILWYWRSQMFSELKQIRNEIDGAPA